MSYGKNLMTVGKGSAAIAITDLLVFKGLPMLPDSIPGASVIKNNPMALRLAIAAGCIFGADKMKSLELPLLIAASHNVNSGVYTIQKVHDFIGIHGGQIDEVASAAVAAIEQGIADEIAKFKEELNDNPLSDTPLSNPLSENKQYEEISDYEMVMG